MTIVKGILQDPESTPIAGALVIARLMLAAVSPVGYVASTHVELLRGATAVTDVDGAWSLDLQPNALITPANTYYSLLVHIPGEDDRAISIVVPNDSAEHWVEDLLSVQPTPGVSPLAYLSNANPLALAASPLPGTHQQASRDDHVHPYTGLSLSTHTHTGVYDPIGAADADIAAHVAALDPHPTYYNAARGAAAFDALGAAAAAVATHAGLSDPHPVYLTATEGNAAYDAIGAASAGDAAHVAASDPHTQYNTVARGDARYAQLAAPNTFTNVQAFTPADSGALTIGLTLASPRSYSPALRVIRKQATVPDPFEFWNYGAQINSQGAWLSNAWLIISGNAAAANPDGVIEPGPPSADPSMIAAWSDVVGPAIVSRTNPTSSPGWNYQAHDRSGNYVFSIEEKGGLMWGAGASKASMDTLLERTASATLHTSGALNVDGVLGFPVGSTRSLINAKDQTNAALWNVMGVDASNNLTLGAVGATWASLKFLSKPVAQLGTTAAWTSVGEYFGGANADNAGATMMVAVGNGVFPGLRFYGGRWVTGDRGGRIVAFNSGGAEKVYLHMNAEGGTLALGTGIGSTGGNGTDRLSISATGLTIDATTPLGWGSSGVATPDTFLRRDAANALAQRNGTTAQILYVYGTFTDTSNYERLTITSGAAAQILHEVAGTGTARPVVIGTRAAANLTFRTANLDRWIVRSDGHFGANADNTFDIGIATSNRPRALYLSAGPVQIYNPGSGIANDATNYERFSATWASNVLTLTNEALGTGVLRGMTLGAASVPITFPGQVLAADGAAATPSLAFASEVNTGFYKGAANDVRFTTTGTQRMAFNAAGLAFRNDASLGWSATTSPGGGNDLFLLRGAANVLAQRNGTNAQQLQIFKSYTDGANFEGLAINAQGGRMMFTSMAAGTGTVRDVVFGINQVEKWRIDATTADLRAITDNSVSIGAAATDRPKALYLAAGPVQVYNSGSGIANDATNYERATFSWSSNRIQFGAENGGTGLTRSLDIAGNGISFRPVNLGSTTGRWNVVSTAFSPDTDNAVDLGDTTHRPRNIYAGTQFLAVDGATANPGFGFASSVNTGMFQSSGNAIDFATVGGGRFRISSGGVFVGASSGTLWLGANIGAGDVGIIREAASTLGLKNVTNAFTLRLYETYTDASNYSRLSIRANAAADYVIAPEALGTGTLRGLQVAASGGRLGFFGVTAVAQPTLAADATDLASAITLVNDLKAKLRAYGLAA